MQSDQLYQKPLSILLVDDDEDDYVIIRDLLTDIEELPLDIEWVNTYAQALQQLQANTYDLCLVDYFLGAKTGLDVIQDARANGSPVPFIILTGSGNRLVDLQAMKIGADYYMEKDRVTAFDLDRAIRYTLERTRLLQEVRAREAVLDQLNTRMNLIFNTTSEAILLITNQGQIEFVNPAFSRQFGYTKDEALKQSVQQIVAPSDAETLSQAVHQVVASGEVYRQQFSGQRKNGATFDIEISLAHAANIDSRVVCTIHDVSHYKAIERMKDQFVSMVSHELRTPITAALLSIGFVQNYYDKLSSERAHEKLAQCRQQIDALRETVDGILELSELETLQGQRGTEQVDIHETLVRVVEELQPNAQAKQQHLQILARPQEAAVTLGNELDFTRIWRNLIGNALKYTPEQGAIRIRLARFNQGHTTDFQRAALADKPQLTSLLDLTQTGYIIGQVEDNGHGIPPEHLNSIFERFNRGWAKGSGIPGTGLGLALVRDLLILYNGDIHVSSQIGQGSTFTFWIAIP